MTSVSPLRVPSRGGRARSPLPAPTTANWPDMGPEFVAAPPLPAALRCPECEVPFEDDGDRYFRAGCLACGWVR